MLDCSKKNDMISSMMNVWFRDEVMKKICHNLVESMPKRIREVIKNKGGILITESLIWSGYREFIRSEEKQP